MASMEEEFVGNPKLQLKKLFNESLKLTFPDEPGVEPLVTASAPQYRKFGDYQCNNVIRIWSVMNPKGCCCQFSDAQALGQAVIKNLPTSELVESCSVNGPGYINVVLSTKWIAKNIENMLINGIDTWAPKLSVKRVVVDFCSPNIPKEMHVGHLRSTIIGETLGRILEYSKVEVLRRNHLGDWGSQFGMLIEYIFEEFPYLDDAAEPTIEELQSLYRESRYKFDKDHAFKEKAQQAVVRLQSGDPVYVEPWAKICEVSRTEAAKVIQRLQVNIEEKGESFYQPFIANMIEELDNKGLIEENDNARMIFIEDVKTPIMLVKKDGGYCYSTTDMAALWYRINEEKAEWIIYVTDEGQHEHFDKLFKAARKAGWLLADDKSYPRASHVGFGVVLGEDGKGLRTLDPETIPLKHLLDEAKTRSKNALIARGKDQEWTLDELDKTAEAVGYSAVKTTDRQITHSHDQMLCDKGQTAVYLLYAHARICSIIKKSGKDIDELKKTGKVSLDHADERALGLHLLQFAETVEEAWTKLLPHLLCDYLYELSEHFTKFYSNCQVNGSAEETGRLLLCEATAIVMRKCFHLLGITCVYKL